MILNNSVTVRAYGCLNTSFIRLKRDIRRRGAFSFTMDSSSQTQISDQQTFQNQVCQDRQAGIFAFNRVKS